MEMLSEKDLENVIHALLQIYRIFCRCFDLLGLESNDAEMNMVSLGSIEIEKKVACILHPLDQKTQK